MTYEARTHLQNVVLTLVGHQHDMRHTPIYGVTIKTNIFWLGHRLYTSQTLLSYQLEIFKLLYMIDLHLKVNILFLR